MPFTLPLATGAVSFALPEDADRLPEGGYADLADEAYDLEDEDPQAARDVYDRALHAAVTDLGGFDGSSPSDYDPTLVEDIAAMLYNRGGVRFDLDDLEGALEDLDASVALAASAGVEGEELAEVLVRRAETKFALADVDGAFADLDEALEHDPDHALAFNNRAVYQSELGHLDEAFADVQVALELDPENALYHVTHAELLVAKGDEGAALDALEAALGFDEEAGMLLDADVFDPIRKHPRFQALGG